MSKREWSVLDVPMDHSIDYEQVVFRFRPGGAEAGGNALAQLTQAINDWHRANAAETTKEMAQLQRELAVIGPRRAKPEAAKKTHRCPDCGKDTDGNKHEGCDMVLGRRGWRQLGVYDG